MSTDHANTHDRNTADFIAITRRIDGEIYCVRLVAYPCGCTELVGADLVEVKGGLATGSTVDGASAPESVARFIVECCAAAGSLGINRHVGDAASTAEAAVAMAERPERLDS